jgi:Protein of unknown function (DUF2924)
MRRKLSEGQSAKLARELTGLAHLDQNGLNNHFRHLYGVQPPTRLRRPLLIRAVAYRLQEIARGGLKPYARQLLARFADNARGRRSTHAPRERKIKPGTTLLREWHGVQHRLTVLEGGVQFGGKRYRSLSEVARKITGSHRSGPLFFGLKSSRTEHHDGTE